MITENLSTLKIHKLSKEQYERELNAGNIDENAIYLTPDEEANVDFSRYATIDQLNDKSDKNHNHDDLYPTKEYLNTSIEDFIKLEDVNNTIYTHNIATNSHNDIRILISDLTDRLNTLADSDDDTLDQLSELVAVIKSNKSIIESITTNKVNVNDIIDNLTTNVSNKPLSAAQGVILNGLIEALNLELENHTHNINDITGLQSALDNKASASHGTHVVYSSIAPVMDGTASVGSASTVARSDHKHPTDTTRASKSEFDTHVDSTTVHITASERTNWNAAKTHANSTHAPSNAEKNQNAFSNIVIGNTTIAADTTTDTLTLVGSNVTLTPTASSDTITIGITKSNVTSALGYTPPTTDTTYSVVSTTKNGLAPTLPNDTSKFLRGDGAWGTPPSYTHPSYTARTGVPTSNQTPAFGGTFNVSQPVSDSLGHITSLNSRTITIPNTVATTSTDGLMTKSMVSKLNGIATGATKVTVDSSLSSTSTNAIQNKAVYAALSNLDYAPKYAYGPSDLTAGVSPLATGTLYFVYE